MTFVCIVCRELLTNHPQNDVDLTGAAGHSRLRPKANIDIVSTKCGHMYHLICLDNWFNKQTNPRQECPYCKSAVVTRDYQRIFPIGDEETDDIESRLAKAKEVQEESAILKNEMIQIENILEETGSQLQDKALALDILQYEFNQKLSEVLNCKENNRLLQEKVMVLESKVASVVESQRGEKVKLEKKLDVANQQIQSLKLELDEKKGLLHQCELNGSFSTNTNDVLLTEIQSLKSHFSSLAISPTSATPKHSMACQTDFPLAIPDNLIDSMSRLDLLDVFTKFLQNEKETQNGRGAGNWSNPQNLNPPPLPQRPSPVPSTNPFSTKSQRSTPIGGFTADVSNSNHRKSPTKVEPARPTPVAAKRTLGQQPPCFFPDYEDSSPEIPRSAAPMNLSRSASSAASQRTPLYRRYFDSEDCGMSISHFRSQEK